MNIYQENILDHAKNPRHFGEINNADQVIEGANPFCGDELKFFFKISQDYKIKDFSWTGRACAICLASTSTLSETLINKKISQVKKLAAKDHLENLGITLSPTRLKCAILPLETLKKLETKR